MAGPVNLTLGFPTHRGRLSFEGLTWVANPTYPLDNAGSQPFTRVARTTGTLAQYATFLDRPRRTQLAALVRHNLSPDATMRRRFYADTALSTLLYDTEWTEVWPEVFPLDQCEWEDDNFWDGKYTAEDLDGYIRTRPIILPELVMPTAVVTDLSDPSNPDGYLEFGLDELAEAWTVSSNMEFGVGQGFAFQTTGKRAWGGRKIYERKDKPRKFEGVIEYLPRDEALAKGFELWRKMDLDQPVLVVPSPRDEIHWVRETAMYNQLDPGLMRWIDVGDYSFPFKFEEALD